MFVMSKRLYNNFYLSVKSLATFHSLQSNNINCFTACPMDINDR